MTTSKKDIQVLAEMFSSMNAGDQAEFFSKVALIFHSWGEQNEQEQIRCIASSSFLKYGRIFIEELFNNLTEEKKITA